MCIYIYVYTGKSVDIIHNSYTERSSRLLPPPKSWRSTIQPCMRWWSSHVTGAAKALAMPPPERGRIGKRRNLSPPHCKGFPQTQGIQLVTTLSMWLVPAPLTASPWIRSVYTSGCAKLSPEVEFPVLSWCLGWLFDTSLPSPTPEISSEIQQQKPMTDWTP